MVMDRTEAEMRFRKFLDQRHTIQWQTYDLWQKKVTDSGGLETCVSDMMELFTIMGFIETNDSLHFLERTDGFYTPNGQWIRIELAARDELEAEMEYLQEFAYVVVSDYTRPVEVPNNEAALTILYRMPLWNTIRQRLG